MSDTYTKLFSSITASTIVSEPLATRWLWVTMLAMADGQGCVWGSIPGLARIANITLTECETALECFLAPDLYSRTKDHDGRRVELVDGGWRLLNHAKYRAIRSAEERREYMREYMRERRAKEDGCKPACKQPLAVSTEVTPPTPTPTPDKEQDQKKKQARLTPPDLSSWPSLPSAEVLADWLAMRKRMRADVSPTVIRSFAGQLAIALAAGYSVDDCLTECVVRTWRGFKAEWMMTSPRTGPATPRGHAPLGRQAALEIANRNAAREWLDRDEDET